VERPVVVEQVGYGGYGMGMGMGMGMMEGALIGGAGLFVLPPFVLLCLLCCPFIHPASSPFLLLLFECLAVGGLGGAVVGAEVGALAGGGMGMGGAFVGGMLMGEALDRRRW
jgi:hypothetical protein